MFDQKTRAAIAEIAHRLEVSPAALMAVVEVESGGRALAKVAGRMEPLIRFEGHYFDRFLKGDARLEARQLGLASPKAGAVKNPRRQAARWDLLHKAIRINRTAALASTSWGVGQVMGSHWQWLGYGSADALVAEARSGVEGQIKLMARYIEKAGLVPALQAQDWAAFARRYNGPAYAKNRYDVKMANAFARHAKGMEVHPPVAPVADKAPALPKTADNQNGLGFGARGPRVKTA
ncbi:MAG: N-acetylmuramidase family protein [Pseudomonadota bacterium]